MYAGLSQDVALAETVFHDVDPSLPAAGVFVSDLDLLSMCRVIVTRALRLADLTDSGLRHMGLSDDQLVHGLPVVYPTSAQWAIAIHDWHARDPSRRVDGLFWESRLSMGDYCFLVFGTRVLRADMSASGAMGLGHSAGYTIVSRFADRIRVAVYD
jgi:hypothetical protein